MFKLLAQLFLELIQKTIEKETKIMAKLTEVQEAIAALKSKVETEHAEVKAAVTFAAQGLKDQIKALQDQIATGTAVTEADLDVIVGQVKDVEAAVGTISDEVTV